MNFSVVRFRPPFNIGTEQVICNLEDDNNDEEITDWRRSEIVRSQSPERIHRVVRSHGRPPSVTPERLEWSPFSISAAEEQILLNASNSSNMLLEFTNLVFSGFSFFSILWMIVNTLPYVVVSLVLRIFAIYCVSRCALFISANTPPTLNCRSVLAEIVILVIASLFADPMTFLLVSVRQVWISVVSWAEQTQAERTAAEATTEGEQDPQNLPRT